jgi:hypothetical protein
VIGATWLESKLLSKQACKGCSDKARRDEQWILGSKPVSMNQ